MVLLTSVSFLCVFFEHINNRNNYFILQCNTKHPYSYKEIKIAFISNHPVKSNANLINATKNSLN